MVPPRGSTVTASAAAGTPQLQPRRPPVPPARRLDSAWPVAPSQQRLETIWQELPQEGGVRTSNCSLTGRTRRPLGVPRPTAPPDPGSLPGSPTPSKRRRRDLGAVSDRCEDCGEAPPLPLGGHGPAGGVATSVVGAVSRAGRSVCQSVGATENRRGRSSSPAPWACFRMGNDQTTVGLSNDATVKQIQEIISDNCVVIFSKTTCSYCRMAKKLFESINVNYTAVELDMNTNGSQVQDILEQMTGGRTVPRVFVNGSFVGGATDTQRLHEEGKLLPLIYQCQLKSKTRSAT
ncbi:glutaredoxin 2 [Lathamus discolor]|uniref:glutaredoxin 2 n=1 Tax=Lathamus discolor TaxID=678569 RepID=UPI0032B7A36C